MAYIRVQLYVTRKLLKYCDSLFMAHNGRELVAKAGTGNKIMEIMFLCIVDIITTRFSTCEFLIFTGKL